MILFNAKASYEDFVHLYLDISPKDETIVDFFFEGPKASSYNEEFSELKNIVLKKSIHECKFLSRSVLQHEHKNNHFQKSVSALSLTLLKEAIVTYLGENKTFKEEQDLLCLCFGVTSKEIVSAVIANKDFDLKTLVQTTRASSACGSCRGQIEALIARTRAEHGLVLGMGNVRGRLNAKGEWIKILDLYPGPLLVKLDALKNEWMEREEILSTFKIEFVAIEGHHLDVELAGTTDLKQAEGLLAALSDYLKSQTGVLFFLHAL